MILSVAHAPVDDATSANVFGEWSNLLVGERPPGMIDCYLLQADGVVQIVATWADEADYDRALNEERSHPAFAVFEASGLDPTLTVFKVMGRLT